MIKEQKKRKTMNLPIHIVKKINEEEYRKWESSSAIALSIIEESCDYVLNLSALPPVDKVSKDLKTSFLSLIHIYGPTDHRDECIRNKSPDISDRKDG